MKNRGVYINYKKEMPGFFSKDIKKIISKIEERDYNIEKNEKFAEKYISSKNLNVTSKLVDIIFELMINGKLEEKIEVKDYSTTKV